MKRVTIILLLSILGYIGFSEELQLFNAGKKAFSVGLYKIAVENFQSFLETSGGNENEDDAIYLIGVSNFYLKKYSNSTSYLEGLLRDYPLSPYIKNSYYWIGLNKFYQKDFQGSINDFSISEKESSYKEISSLYSSLAYTHLGDREKAKNKLIEVSKNSSSGKEFREEALYRLATLYLEDKNNNRGITSLNTLVLDYPDSKYYIEALNLLGETYFLIKEWGSAKRTYSLLLEEKDIDYSTIYKRLATACWELNDIEESINWLKRYKNEIGFDPQVEYMLSDIYIKTSRFDLAKKPLIELYRYNGVEDKKRDDIGYKLGIIYFKESNFNEAFKYFSKLSSKEANYYSVLSGLNEKITVSSNIMVLNKSYSGDKLTIDANNRYINYLKKSSRNRELEETLIMLTDIYPSNISYALTLGELYLEKKQWDKSIKYLSRGYSRDSKFYSDISYKLGWIYYNKGEYDRAIGYFDKPKKGEAEFNKALYSKGIAQYKLGKTVSGEKTFKTLLKESSTYDKEVSYYLGLIEKDRGNYKDAISYFKVAAKSRDLELDSLSNIGWSYYLLRDFNSAYKYYSRLMELDASSIHRINSANSLYYLERFEEALELYKEVYIRGDENLDSSNYKVIEILFRLERDSEALKWSGNSKVNSSKQLLAIGDNFLNSNEYKRGLKVYNWVIKNSSGEINKKARESKGTLLFKDGKYNDSFKLFIDLINESNDNYGVDEFIKNIREINDPQLVNIIVDKLELEESKKQFIPVYIELLDKLSFTQNNLDLTEKLLGIAKNSREFYSLSFIKANYLVNSNVDESKSILKGILENSAALNSIKAKSIFLMGSILTKENKPEEAASLYLNLYLNYPKSELTPEALYRSYSLLKDIDKEQSNKVMDILNKEYSGSIWRKKVNEN